MSQTTYLAALTIFAAIAAPVAGAQAAGSDQFCTQLKAVVADAPNGFASLQGSKTRQEPSSTDAGIIFDHYAVSSALDGAASCEMTAQEAATSDGKHFPNYSCDFPITGSDKGAATKKLAGRVTACLPGVSHPSGPGLRKDGGMLTAHSADYTVSYSFISGPAHSNISFSIQSGTK
jgi:hypothetical protein